MKTETKPLTFYVEDVEQLRELFPDFANGKMKANELGTKIVEILKAQPINALSNDAEQNDETLSSLSAENEQLKESLSTLKVNFEQLKDELKALKEQLKVLKAENEELKQSNDTLSSLSAENEQLKESLSALNENLKQSQSSESELKETLKATESRLKELKAQLKAATAESETYAFTPYFKQLVAVVAEKINAVSGTAYSPTDVIMQTLFATYFNSHTSIRYTYPISKTELLALAQQFYPELQSEKELFELMIYKVKEEQA